MATSSKASVQSSALKETIPFEEALAKLGTIVDAMETGDLPLETLLARFEEGTRLIQICQGKLEEAELKVQKLEQEVSGECGLKRLDTSDAED